jgi:antirestriction protein ArdC
MAEPRADIYTRITAEIIAAIEAGAGHYRMPWHHNGSAVSRPANVSSQRRYRGANVLALWIAAEAAGYADGIWGTYRQWQAAGAQVRRGEKGAAVMLWKHVASSDNGDDEDDDTSARRRIFARAFTVFNAAQVDGYAPPPIPVLSETERCTAAERFIGHLGITTVFEGSEAYYRPSDDTVYMPPFSQFRDAASFYGVALHEYGHASGAKHRLARDLSGRFGSAAYAMEEISVELLSGMILADLGIAHHPRPDHAAYISSWLEILKRDPRAIVTAASKAQAAADWMHAQQPRPAGTTAGTAGPAAQKEFEGERASCAAAQP